MASEHHEHPFEFLLQELRENAKTRSEMLQSGDPALIKEAYAQSFRELGIDAPEGEIEMDVEDHLKAQKAWEQSDRESSRGHDE